ncbi:MAG: acetylglutamate kinase [Endomicrobium sp.]|jgi:acetylglutamate kinase|nr:acetylglutamate kinase [Endomicrobium sp.]
MKMLTVVKFGGSLTKNSKAQSKFLKELAGLARRQNIILVHGGGPEINLLLEKFEIKSKFINGLRFTDSETLTCVETALSGKVNRTLVSGLLKHGAPAVGFSAKDAKTVIAKQIKSLGFAGAPVKVNKKLIETLIKAGFLPVIASVAASADGSPLNVNADTLATAIAVAFKADKLIFLTDVAGVFDKNKKTIASIKLKDIPALIKDETITGGMIPKIKGCADAVKKGVKEVWIADGAAGIKSVKGTAIRAKNAAKRLGS